MRIAFGRPYSMREETLTGEPGRHRPWPTTPTLTVRHTPAPAPSALPARVARSTVGLLSRFKRRLAWPVPTVALPPSALTVSPSHACLPKMPIKSPPSHWPGRYRRFSVYPLQNRHAPHISPAAPSMPPMSSTACQHRHIPATLTCLLCLPCAFIYA